MKDRIEQILEDSEEWKYGYDGNDYYAVNTDIASKELYNLFIEEQIKLLENYKKSFIFVEERYGENKSSELLESLLASEILELQKLKQ